MDTKINSKTEKREVRENDIVFSKAINAGKRIYYLDVKQNRNGELFLVITESKKVIKDNDEKPVSFEKHKIFLYKEDFDKFSEAIAETIGYIKQNNKVNFVPRKENRYPVDDIL